MGSMTARTAEWPTATSCQDASTGCRTAAGSRPARTVSTVLPVHPARRAGRQVGTAKPRHLRTRPLQSRTRSAVAGRGRRRLLVRRCRARSPRVGPREVRQDTRAVPAPPGFLGSLHHASTLGRREAPARTELQTPTVLPGHTGAQERTEFPERRLPPDRIELLGPMGVSPDHRELLDPREPTYPREPTGHRVAPLRRRAALRVRTEPLDRTQLQDRRALQALLGFLDRTARLAPMRRLGHTGRPEHMGLQGHTRLPDRMVLPVPARPDHTQRRDHNRLQEPTVLLDRRPRPDRTGFPGLARLDRRAGPGVARLDRTGFPELGYLDRRAGPGVARLDRTGFPELGCLDRRALDCMGFPGRRASTRRRMALRPGRNQPAR